MITDTVLEQGIVRGIVTTEQVASLRNLARDMAAVAVPEPEDDEKLRFVTGFSDIFVTLGLGLFTTALWFLANSIIGLAGTWGLLAIASWFLAEFFTRRRRMALPSIVLVCLFSFAVFKTADNIFAVIEPEASKSSFNDLIGISVKNSIFVIISALITMVMLVLHYWRFRVPITIAAATAALALAALSALVFLVPNIPEWTVELTVFAIGCATFSLAMRYDLSDPERVTRRNDIAFWLHLLAAPFVVHPLISWVMDSEFLPQAMIPLAVLIVFALLGAIAVAIDRRAMLVSGLTSAGFAFSSLISQMGLADRTWPITLLVLGAFVLLLSAGWRPIRTALLRLLPNHLAQRLPHPILSSS
jgi:hypothetical protein